MRLKLLKGDAGGACSKSSMATKKAMFSHLVEERCEEQRRRADRITPRRTWAAESIFGGFAFVVVGE